MSTLLRSGIDPNRPAVRAEIEEVAVGGDSVALANVFAQPRSTIAKALAGRLAENNWPSFTAELKRIFESVRAEVHGGDPATYIPVLAEANRDWFAVSVCTVDGQEWSYGDQDVRFSIQSCVKPVMYAVAVEDRGLKYVHRNGPGYEPSGLSFNDVSLNSKNQPHNPYINSGE